MRETVGRLQGFIESVQPESEPEPGGTEDTRTRAQGEQDEEDERRRMLASLGSQGSLLDSPQGASLTSSAAGFRAQAFP